MNALRRLFLPAALSSFVFAVSVLTAAGADAPSNLTASGLASKLSALRQDGSSYVRFRMDVKGPKAETLQIQAKQRLTKEGSEVVYQILFPKERKGESLLLHRKDGHSSSGTVFVPPSTTHPIEDMSQPVFGSNLACEDVVDNFYGWEQQSLGATETVNGIVCQILESKPGKGDHSSYTSVRSWIDTGRMVPMRIEKYSGAGQLARRIDTTRVVADGGRQIPADLVVTGAHTNASTAIDGSRIKHDVNYTDADFSPDALKQLNAPRSGGQE